MSENETVVLEEWVSKADACQLLGGVSERAIQRYAAKGDIKVDHRRRAGGGSEAYYSKLDILALKHRLEQPRSDAATAALVRASGRAMVPIKAEIPEKKSQTRKPDVRVAEKLILTPAEASALTHLSIDDLRDDLRAGKLKGFIRGRGWKIKRTDLDDYVRGL